MSSISIGTWTKTAILLVTLLEPAALGWRTITNDAIIQNVWPESGKIKRASIANIGLGNENQVSSKPSPQSADNGQDDDDFLVFEGRYFNPNEVPPPPPFMVVNSNWRGKSPSKDTDFPPSLPVSSSPSSSSSLLLQKEHRTEEGRLPIPPKFSQKFTLENVKHFKKQNSTTSNSDSDSTSSNNSPVPLEDLQYHEEELIAFEAAYKDAPKCYTPTDVPGRCIPFRNCFPVVFNVIDGELRNPGLAKLLYQASGPCNASLELDFALQKSKDHKKYFNAKFYNQSICCPGFKHPPTLLKAWTSDIRTTRLTSPTTPPSPKASSEGDGDASPSVSDSNPVKNGDTAFEGSSTNGTMEEEPFLPSTVDDGIGNTTPVKVNKARPVKADESSVEVEQADAHEVFDDEDESADVRGGGMRGDQLEFDGVELDDFEREQMALVDTEIVKENPRISPGANYTRLDDDVDDEGDADGDAEERRGDRDKKKEDYDSRPSFGRPSDTYLAVEAPSVSPTCQHQLHGMPRGHWPWMVALVISSRHICSGALVDDRHVITAAHCVYLLNESDVKKLRIIIGDRVMYSSIDGPHFWRKVNKITTHVNYNQQTFASDIAILKLHSPVPFSRNVQPISLPDGSFDGTNYRNAIVAGWSGADIGQPSFEPRTEVETVVDIMDKSECRDLYRGFALSGLATNTFCTKPANNTCVADSGAPLIARIQNCWRLVGIMSWGIGCSHFPEVYTDVGRYMSWIRKHLE